MRQYSEEFKSSIIAKMLPPNSIPVPDLAQDTGVPKDTLYSWRIKHQRSNGNATAKQVSSGGLNPSFRTPPLGLNIFQMPP
ncbi:MAG: transposase [Pseudomonadota bacterium]